MSIFGCLLTGFFSILIVAFVLLRGVFNTILTLLGLRQPRQDGFQQFRKGNPFGQRTSSQQQQPQQQSRQQHSQSHSDTQRTAGRQKNKIFERNAGEYVDFEEVK